MAELAEKRSAGALRRVGARLADRLIRCLPAATFEMETLVRLAGVEASEEIETAAVTCEGRPRLLLNPDFVAAHCKRDEHLFLLAMHELWHVLLAHTTLYPRATPAQNIAFDAVINAGLCRQFPGPEYRGFFESVNAADEFPGLLLRPPVGWPRRPRVPHGVGPDGTVHVMERLYPRNNAPGVAMPLYVEILRLLAAPPQKKRPPIVFRGKDGKPIPWEEEPGSGEPGSQAPVLLGNHEDEQEDAAAADDPRFGEVVRRIVSAWPPPPIPIGGRDAGGETEDWRHVLRPAPEAARRAFSTVLRRVLGPVAGGETRKRRAPVRTLGGLGPLPSAADRLSPARQALGLPDLLHPQPVEHFVRSPHSPASAHVYVDVSGSMAGVLPYVVGLLAPYVAARRIRLFQFSTAVYPLELAKLRAGELKSTFGTEIACVLRHALGVPRLRKALILTDGYVGKPSASLAHGVAERGLRLHAVLPAENASRDDLVGLARSLTILPPLTGGGR